jgi:hypothetical protein
MYLASVSHFVARDSRDALQEWLPMLVPILLRCMVYSDDDPILLANEEEDNAMIPDQTKVCLAFLFLSFFFFFVP